jgi:AraC-like DNA-binding protein
VAAPFSVTTRGLPPPARAQALSALVERGLLPIEPLPDRTPHVDLIKWPIPNAALLSATFAGVRQRGADASDQAAQLFFGINLTGTSLAHQHRHELTVQPGQAILVDPRAGAFAITRPAPTRLLGVRLPLDVFDPGATDPTPRLLPAHTTALRLLAAYLRALFDGPPPTRPDLTDAVARHVTELITLALRPSDDDIRAAATPSVRAARLQAIKSDIERHLTDPSLDVTTVAARHRISPRYLHMLFAEDDTTFGRHLLDHRLDLAHTRLRDPRWSTRTISAIAHDSGFGDLSYFTRTFRRRFAITPSEVRRTPPSPGR